MNAVDIIKKKRNGKSLSRVEIDFFIESYLNKEITDYQASAFLMAIYFQSMNNDEILYLTESILNSGEVIDLSFLDAPKVDKHSTGGVGDKTSIILAPLIAAKGLYVPMISGRGLGHTGGTLDKLESIPGFNVNLDRDEYRNVLKKCGCVMVGQTESLAPADKKLYALRDVTATVDSLPLITSSILGKKLAEGAEALVFDVKMGSGANLQDEKLSYELAHKLVDVSKKFGKKAIAILTDMNEPLGMKIGNWFEVEECIEMMKGKYIQGLYEVNNTLAGAMLYLGNKASSIDEGKNIAAESLKIGTVYDKFQKLIESQGGNVSYINDYTNPKRAKYSLKIKAKQSGYINKMDAYGFGLAAIELGCGRKKMSDSIDYLSGIILHKKCTEKVTANDEICTLYAEKENFLAESEKIIYDSIVIGSIPVEKREIIIDIIY